MISYPYKSSIEEFRDNNYNLNKFRRNKNKNMKTFQGNWAVQGSEEFEKWLKDNLSSCNLNINGNGSNMIYWNYNLSNSSWLWDFDDEPNSYKKYIISIEELDNYYKTLKNINNMETNEFIIEGSKHLVKAFLEETGLFNELKEVNFNSLEVKVCINKENKNSFTWWVVNDSCDNNYILPQDWNLGLNFVKELQNKTKFKIGDWVYWENICDSYGIFKYGEDNINADNKWYKCSESYSILDGRLYCEKNSKIELKFCKMRLATDEELTIIFTKVAEYKGYKEGVIIESLISGDKLKIGNSNSASTIYYSSKNEFVYGGYKIYSDGGAWAKILNKTPDIEINGYKAEFFDGYVQFGCAKIDINIFLSLNKALELLRVPLYKGNRQLESIKIGKDEFTIKQIEQIAEYYLNNDNTEK